MTKEKNRAAVSDIAWLAACAVNGLIPDAARAAAMDTETLYQAAEQHGLTGITAMALESAGVKTEAFTQAKGKAVRKTAAFDLECARVLSGLEDAGIWHMPLKGIVLKELYPKLGMRQMSDVDILVDPSRSEDVYTVMYILGFRGAVCLTSKEDMYYKQPIYHFEMHRALIDGARSNTARLYYSDVKSRLLPDEGKQFGYHFSDEDFYIYMIAHEYTHYSGGGTGLRSLLDIYVYCLRKGGALDWAYIACELEKLGLTEFEARNRRLAMGLFSGETLTGEDEALLRRFISSGTYGNFQNRTANGISDAGGGFIGKLKYVGKRLFPPVDSMINEYPLFARYRFLIPLLPFWRMITALTRRRKRLLAEWKLLTGHKEEK